jgi:hypothetical protein
MKDSNGYTPNLIAKRGHLTFVSSIVEHIDPVSITMRPEDVHECSIQGESPRSALMTGFKTGMCFTVLLGDVPVAMTGVVPIDRDSGRIWLLGSVGLEQNYISLARGSTWALGYFEKMFPVLGNIIPASNLRAIEWLIWLGFDFHSDVVMSGGVPCLEFVRCTPEPQYEYKQSSRPVMC